MKTFFYEFPKIKHIDQMLEAIDGRLEFFVKHDEAHNYKVINYHVALEDTFPEVTSEREALLREARGITFDATSGKVINRKFNKFFNAGEKPETRELNLSYNHILLEKLDGSMITFLRNPVTGKIQACTKMGFTEIAKQVDEFIRAHPHYEVFINHMMESDVTCIFEWCSRQQRIVIDYPVDAYVS